jgi:hypothetical protein
MAFYISTGVSAVTLDDLGQRIIAANTTNFDLESEYPIEQLRYSASIANAIYSNGASVTDQLGRVISAQGSLGATAALLSLANMVENTDHLPEGTTNKYYTDARARAAISIAAGSSSYLSYNNSTGALSISALSISSVTVDSTYASLSAWITGANYSSGNAILQNGDTLILTAATGGTQVWINNGGTAYTTADFTQIESPFNTASVRSSLSNSAPITYNTGTGVIGITQATTSTDGYLSSANWNTFNNKQNALTIGNLTSSDIVVSNGTGAIIGTGSTLTITKSNLTEATSSVLTITGGTNSVLGAGTTIQVKQANTTTSGYLSSTDWNTFNNRMSWKYDAGKANDSTNSYLNNTIGIASNASPYVVPVAATLKALSLMTSAAATWTLQLIVNGVSAATLTATAVNKAYSSGLAVAVAAGDEISFYCSGTAIPNITASAIFEV